MKGEDLIVILEDMSRKYYASTHTYIKVYQNSSIHFMLCLKYTCDYKSLFMSVNTNYKEKISCNILS